MDIMGDPFAVNPLEEFPLDGIDLDRRVNDVLGVPGVHSSQPEDGPGIRYSKFVSLDQEGEKRLEFFVETKVDQMPRNRNGYELDEVKMVTGVMMRQRIGRTETGFPRVVESYIPEERFVEDLLTDKVAQIRAARWFAEYKARAAFDDETLESVNEKFVPGLPRDPDKNPFVKVYH